MKTIITYGTFDLFHVGHVRLLRRLKEMGDRLIIGCSTDEFNTIKGKKTVMSYSQRVEVLESCKYVDQVFPEINWEQKSDDIQKYHADIFAMGNDWVGHFDDLEKYCEVIYLPRTEDISTTEIKQMVNSLHRDQLEQVKHMTQNLLSLIERI